MLLWFYQCLYCQMPVGSKPVWERRKYKSCKAQRMKWLFLFFLNLVYLNNVHYLSATLCHNCASVFLFFHQSQEDPAMRNVTERKPTKGNGDSMITGIFLPCNALPTSLSEGRTLLFDHANQCWHHTSIQQLFQSLLHIRRCILFHGKTDRLM